MAVKTFVGIAKVPRQIHVINSFEMKSAIRFILIAAGLLVAGVIAIVEIAFSH